MIDWEEVFETFKMPVINIDTRSWYWIIQVALERSIPKQAARAAKGIGSTLISDRHTDGEADVGGAAGEFAVAFYLGGKIDTGIYYLGDGGIDLTIAGKTIQVKTQMPSKNPLGALYFNLHTDFTADYAVKCTVWREREIVIVGYMERQEFLDEYEIMNFGASFPRNGDRDAVPAEKLHPVSELKELLNGNLHNQAPVH